MGFAADIRDLLSTGGFADAPVFGGDLPERPHTALCVTQTAGLGSTHAFGGVAGSPTVEHMRFQLRARATDYSTAETVINAAHAIVDGMRTKGMNGRLYQWITGDTTPFYIGLDEEDRPLFGCNYAARRSLDT